MARAKADHNIGAIHDPQSIAPYATGTAAVPVDAILTQRKWLNRYDGAVWRRLGADSEANAMALAPEYSDADVREAFKG